MTAAHSEHAFTLDTTLDQIPARDWRAAESSRKQTHEDDAASGSRGMNRYLVMVLAALVAFWMAVTSLVEIVKLLG